MIERRNFYSLGAEWDAIITPYLNIQRGTHILEWGKLVKAIMHCPRDVGNIVEVWECGGETDEQQHFFHFNQEEEAK